MRLDLHVSSFLKVHVPQNNLRALFNAEVVHHPNGNVAHTLLSREFEYTAVSLYAHLRVRDHEGHWVLNAETCQLVQG